METILKQELKGSYQGYELQSFYTTKLDEYGMTLIGATRLKRIPRKISYFLDRTKISKAWKTNCEADPRDNSYFILSITGTMFEAVY